MSTLAQKCPVLLITNDQSGKLAENLREVLEGLSRLRLEVTSSVSAAHTTLLAQAPALVIVHVARPGDAIWCGEILRTASSLPEPVGTVVIGEGDQAEAGLALLRQGAIDYLERPLNLRLLGLLIDVLTVRARQRVAAEPVPNEAIGDGPGGSFVYCRSAAMERIIEQARCVAGVDSNILIQGETGTGKTRLARIIHDLSPRKDEPFLVVNCAALSATLIESEMFGHTKGSFTGADRDRVGKFAAAGGGTIFLDEVDSLPLELQAKLLRVVEERVFEQVGSNVSLQLRARLITAANKPLGVEVGAGRFRSDLYFRLNVVTFEMPPLRARPEAFSPMVSYFLDQFSTRAGRRISGITPGAMAALESYRWPGNIRELRNAIERAVALRPEGCIELADLPDTVRDSVHTAEQAALVDTAEMPALSDATSPHTLADTKAEAEAAHILAVLRKNNNNRARTAAELGISRETLYKKLHRYHIFDRVG